MCSDLEQLRKDRDDLKRRIKAIDSSISSVKNRGNNRKLCEPLLGKWFKVRKYNADFLFVDFLRETAAQIFIVQHNDKAHLNFHSQYTTTDFETLLQDCKAENQVNAVTVEEAMAAQIRSSLEVIMSKAGQ